MAGKQTQQALTPPIIEGRAAPSAAKSSFLPSRIRPAAEKQAAGFSPVRTLAVSEIKEVARAGVQGRGGKLPHLARIQPALEKHDLGGVRAFTDAKAAAACQLLGAEAYTFGNRVAFRTSNPSLGTASHESAHAVQQGLGMCPAGGVGREGDRFEKEADRMAAAVLRGHSRANPLSAGERGSFARAASSKHLGIEAVQLQTVIKGSTNQVTYAKQQETVGASMTAALDPNDPAMGSAPGPKEQIGLMHHLKGLGFKSLVRGHLMNGQLGGPGIASNLFPITSKANSAHKVDVENYVKRAVTDGYQVNYAVAVEAPNFVIDSSTPDISASFVCKASQTNPVTNTTEDLLDVTIKSEPELGTKGTAEAIDNTTDEEPEGILFNSNQLPTGWGEIGRGKTYGAHYTAS